MTRNESLEKHHGIWRTITDVIDNPVMIINGDADLTYANVALSQLLGYSTAELLSINLHSPTPIFSNTDWLHALESSRTTGNHQFDTQCIRSDGSTRTIQFKVEFVAAVEGFFIVTADDISQACLDNFCQYLLDTALSKTKNFTQLEHTYQLILDFLCQQLGFSVGHLHLTDDVFTHQCCISNQPSYGNQENQFSIFTAGLTQGKLNRRLTQNMTTQYMPDLISEEHISLRQCGCSSQQLTRVTKASALGIPIVSGGKLFAVLGLFSEISNDIHPGIIHTCNNIGKQLGYMTETLLIQKNLEARTKRLSKLMQLGANSAWCVELIPPVDITLSEPTQLAQIYDRAVLVEANDLAANRMGREVAGALLHKKLKEVLDKDKFLDLFKSIVRENYHVRNNKINIRSRPATISIEAQGVIDNNQLHCIWVTGSDVTQARRLELQTARLKALIENSSDGVWCVELRPPVDISLDLETQLERLHEQGVFVEANDIAAHARFLPNAQAMIEKPIKEIFSFEIARPLIESLVKGNYNLQEFEIESAIHLGTTYSYELRGVIKQGALTHLWAMERDISARVKSTSALVRKERLEAVRDLAKQVVHDGNNKLAIILGSAELLDIDKDDPKRIEEHATHLTSASKGLKSLLNKLGLFSNTGQSHKSREIMTLGKLIKQAVLDSKSLLRHYPDRIININFHSYQPVQIMGNLIELGDVVLNLVKNSIEAMPDGGALGFTSGIQQSRPYITVSDTGIGMNKEIKKKLFDLYFSTKGTDRGIGMSSVFGKMDSYGGEITFQSTEGEGTSFTLWFPNLDQTI